MLVNAAPQQELIPGYIATERLGAGGYGEVWKVDAPGGLQKAVKVIYGYLTEERATRELKALNQVKMLRHPFLLSLERIEVVDGRLMIVTELADMSLIDRFEQCRKANLPGIPRDELLGYLHDAADALDFMLQTHSLQHLDVKPENLLLVSGRTKVADFGLVKEIADKTRSLVAAMTPTYAAPEVFEGKASRNSDQYSLAIVFQEMLTGVLPFPGRTAQQLEAQHTRNRPQLSSVPPADRDTLNRALAKRPLDRFASCRELIDALRNSQRAVAVPVEVPDARPRDDQGTRAKLLDDTHPTVNRPPSDPPPSQRTEIIGTPVARAPSGPRPVTAPRQATASRRRSTAREEPPEVNVVTTTTDLPSPAVESAPASIRPAMFIGVGKTGMLVLEKLSGRFRERWGEAALRDGFPMLVVETDSAVLKQTATRQFDSQNVAHVPLRQAHDYRGDSDELLTWLGRRWLYNIPKSGETLGMRPLGRLALLDHAASIVSKLRPRLAALTNGTAATALETLAPGEIRPVKPRVFIVGSCCGGTGGGALLELAYAVRNVTKRFGAGELEVCAIVTHSTNQCPTQAQLAFANTVAFLTELQHYARCGAEGLAGATNRTALFEGSEFPLDLAYYVELGNDLTPEAYDDQITALADYLYCDVATPLGAALDTCREPQPEAELQLDLQLRSFRLARFDGLGADVLPKLAEHLAWQTAQNWLADAAGQKDIARRYVQESATGSPDAGETDFALRSLGSCAAAQWWTGQEAAAFPSPTDPTKTDQEARVQALRQTARQALLKELLALRKELAESQPVGELTALLARMKQQGREARLEHYCQVLGSQTLEQYGQLLTATIDTPDRPALKALLFEAAQQSARALFCELSPDMDVLEDGAIRASCRPALAYLEQRAQVRYPFGCNRRMYLLSPQHWLPAAAAEELTRAGQGHLEAAQPHAFVCEELAGISLGQLIDKLTSKHVELLDVVEHLHSRIDIEWCLPARPVVAGEAV